MMNTHGKRPAIIREMPQRRPHESPSVPKAKTHHLQTPAQAHPPGSLNRPISFYTGGRPSPSPCSCPRLRGRAAGALPTCARAAAENPAEPGPEPGPGCLACPQPVLPKSTSSRFLYPSKIISGLSCPCPRGSLPGAPKPRLT